MENSNGNISKMQHGRRLTCTKGLKRNVGPAFSHSQLIHMHLHFLAPNKKKCIMCFVDNVNIISQKKTHNNGQNLSVWAKSEKIAVDFCHRLSVVLRQHWKNNGYNRLLVSIVLEVFDTVLTVTLLQIDRCWLRSMYSLIYGDGFQQC